MGLGDRPGPGSVALHRLALAQDLQQGGVCQECQHLQRRRFELAGPGKDLLAVLGGLRYPDLTARLETFQQALAAAALPEPVTAEHARHFEGGTLTFTLRARTPAELRSAALRLAALADDPAGEALFRAGLPFDDPE